MNWNISELITIVDLMAQSVMPVAKLHRSELDDLLEIKSEMIKVKVHSKDTAKRKFHAKGAISEIAHLVTNTKVLSIPEQQLLEKIATYLNAI